jgi:hypothetical protein
MGEAPSSVRGAEEAGAFACIADTFNKIVFLGEAVVAGQDPFKRQFRGLA